MNANDDIANDNQRRAVAITLAMLDEMLCRVEEWARGREVRSVLYEERNPLSDEQRATLLAEASRIRATIAALRDRLNLPRRIHSALDDIWGHSAALRESLMELGADSSAATATSIPNSGGCWWTRSHNCLTVWTT